MGLSITLAGTIDSSGMRFWYIDTPREHDAGIVNVGYSVTQLMIVPPNTKNFTITGLVNDECTNQVSNTCNYTCPKSFGSPIIYGICSLISVVLSQGWYSCVCKYPSHSCCW